MGSRRYFDAASILGLAAMAEMGKMEYESSRNDKKQSVRKSKLTPAQQKQKAKNRKKRKNKKR